jgi:hypothetical protein
MSHFSKKKTKKNEFPPPHAHGLKGAFRGAFFSLRSAQGAFTPWTLPERSLKNQGAHILRRNHAPESRSEGERSGSALGSRSLNAPLRSAIRERVRGGGGGRSPVALFQTIVQWVIQIFP